MRFSQVALSSLSGRHSHIVKERLAVFLAKHTGIVEVQRQGLGNHVAQDLVHAHAFLESHQGEAHAMLMRASV